MALGYRRGWFGSSPHWSSITGELGLLAHVIGQNTAIELDSDRLQLVVEHFRVVKLASWVIIVSRRLAPALRSRRGRYCGRQMQPLGHLLGAALRLTDARRAHTFTTFDSLWPGGDLIAS